MFYKLNKIYFEESKLTLLKIPARLSVRVSTDDAILLASFSKSFKM